MHYTEDETEDLLHFFQANDNIYYPETDYWINFDYEKMTSHGVNIFINNLTFFLRQTVI